MRSVVIPEKTQELILTAVGQDRPGMVAAVTRILFETGCNIEDSEMAQVRGTFAMILSLTVPAQLTQKKLLQKLSSLKRSMGLAFTAEKNPTKSLPKPVRSKHAIISVYGGDKPGIVHRVTKILAQDKINITQVNTKLVEHKDPTLSQKTLYVMVMEVDVPESVALDSVKEKLQQLAKSLGVDINLLPHEPLEI